MTASEPDKLSLFLSEAHKFWLQNPQLVTGEPFFRLWQENCRPVPFPLPQEGLRLNGQTFFAQVWTEARASHLTPIVYADWWHGAPTHPYECAMVVCELGPLARTVLLPFDEHGSCNPTPGPERELASEDNLQGENIEAMFDVATHLKQRFPALNLSAAKDRLICQAIRELDGNSLDATVARRLLRCNATTRRQILRNVIDQMAHDEVDAQLTLGLDFGDDDAPPPADDTAAQPPPLTVLTIPARGPWDISQDIDLLLDTETEILRQEHDILLSLGLAQPLAPPTPEATQILSIPLLPEAAEAIREGMQFHVFPHGEPKNRLATLTADILDGNSLIGTLAWTAPELARPLDAKLFATPRKGAQEFIVRALQTFRQQLHADSFQSLTALRALLGLDPLPCACPPANAPHSVPDLDEWQTRALNACLLDDNPLTLVQGPPGTGKTTVIETLVRHLVRQNRRILITAPSNAAVDNICRRLRDLPLLRHASMKDAVAADIAPFWASDDHARSAFDAKTRHASGQIHAGTHVGLLRSPRIAEHLEQLKAFDVIIFDEAGMSRTAEAMLCLALARRACLFGDPLQLPPIPLTPEVQQAIAARHPSITCAQRSFISQGLLTWLQFHRQLPAIMLQICYRCQNPRLMRFASLLFYNGRIRPNPSASYYRLPWRERQRLFPPQTIQFISTSKLPPSVRNEQLVLDGRQPGYLNHAEAKICVRLVLQKLHDGIPRDEIAVISPYRKQIKLIRELLKAEPHPDCSDEDWKRFRHTRISTIDSFQGGESTVVIISYVRSGGNSVGFIDDPNRVNVTHTRAKREMVVIGDLDFLQQHAQGRIFLRLAKNIRRDGIITECDELTHR